MTNKIRKFVFDYIRKYFWKDYDPNEDFTCGVCGKQMLNRYLCCSNKCTNKYLNSKVDK